GGTYLERTMSLQVELCEHLAQDCLKAAKRTKDPQTRELLLNHAVQWMQDALAALKQSRAGRASAGDLSPTPHGQRNSQTNRPLGYEIETRIAPRWPPWLAATNKCLAQKSKSRTGPKMTKKRRSAR